MNIENVYLLAQQKGLNISVFADNTYQPKEPSEDKEYTINDCIIVRTTDIFPMNKIMQTPANGLAIEKRTSDYFREILYTKLGAKYPDKGINPVSQKLYSQELDEFDICSQFYRRTIHGTINGLVESHPQGDFSNRPYIVMDPVKHHIADKSLVGMRVEDIYFNDDVALSEDAILLIPYSSLANIINNEEYLETLRNFKIVVFNGSEELAVRYVLDQLGYDSFVVNNHGYVDSVQGRKMIKCVSDFAEKNNISRDRHFDSQIRMEDNNIRFKFMEESEKAHLYYILDNSPIDNNLKEEIKYYCENNFTHYLEEKLSEIVDIIGLDRLKELTQEYNKSFVEQINMKKGINTL